MKTTIAVFSILLLAVVVTAQTTNDLSDAEIQGRQLAQKLCDARPTENFTNTGVLQIRDGQGKRSEFPFTNQVVKKGSRFFNSDSDYWVNYYIAYRKDLTKDYPSETLSIIIKSNQANNYFHHLPMTDTDGEISRGVDGKSDKGIMTPFAGSDFWLCDFGLEFFHWPEQKILKKEIKRSRGCSVLESTNPEPSTNGYSRVVSWIDNDGGGIVQAFAYDAQGKLLKEFYPENVKKVNGQYQVQEMEMLNDQTKSRTRLEFDLKK